MISTNKFIPIFFAALMATATIVEARIGDLQGNEERNLFESAKITTTNTYPLSLCQGDCDNDSDCMDGLKCFHRAPNQFVPLCAGGEDHNAKTDFCVPAAVPDSEIPFLGREQNTNAGDADHEPLAECRGDCDSDADCQTGLVCFQRDSNTPVPGCRGTDRSRTDYCIDPANLNSGGTSFSNTYSVSFVTRIRYGLAGTAQNRQPTDAEYQGLLQQTDKWLTDEMSDHFGDNGQRDFLHCDAYIQNTEYTPSENTWTHTVIYSVEAFWAANSRAPVPTNADVLFAFSDGRFNRDTYIDPYLKNSPPDSNIFRSTGAVEFLAMP